MAVLEHVAHVSYTGYIPMLNQVVCLNQQNSFFLSTMIVSFNQTNFTKSWLRLCLRRPVSWTSRCRTNSVTSSLSQTVICSCWLTLQTWIEESRDCLAKKGNPFKGTTCWKSKETVYTVAKTEARELLGALDQLFEWFWSGGW